MVAGPRSVELPAPDERPPLIPPLPMPAEVLLGSEEWKSDATGGSSGLGRLAFVCSIVSFLELGGR